MTLKKIKTIKLKVTNYLTAYSRLTVLGNTFHKNRNKITPNHPKRNQDLGVDK